jgi:acyl-CoA thioester hydrolase
MSEIDDYPIKVQFPIHWGDMDSFKHINNVMFFRYMETARIKYFENIGFLDFKKKTGVGPILAKTSCQFIRPIRYPDIVTVGVRVESIGNTSFVMNYILESEKEGISARGYGIIVAFDYHKSEKVQVPPEIIQAIRKIENKEL